MKNLMEKLEHQGKKINSRYSVYPQELEEILQKSGDKLMVLYNCCILGYMQGHKAALAEQKRKNWCSIMSKEVWKDIKGYEGLYQISTLGRVRIAHGDIIEPRIQHGIHKVLLIKKNRCHQLDVHTIVADTFLYKPYNSQRIEHIDGNMSNNSVDNLKWVVINPALQKQYPYKLNNLENFS